MVKTRPLLSASLAGGEDWSEAVSFQRRSTEKQRSRWGSCKSTEEGYKLTQKIQGKVGLETMCEPSYGEGVSDRQVDKQGNRALDREHSTCKGPGTCSVRVGTPSSLVLLEQKTKP